MIAGRPANLVLGAVTAVINVIALIAGSQGHPVDPSILAAVNVAAGAIISLIANQPPTVAPGDTVTVKTESGQPNYTIVAAATPPPVTVPDA